MSLGTKLAASVAALVVLATLLTSGAALVSARNEVASDVDEFLIARADDIVSGVRAKPDQRQGKGDKGDRGDDQDSAADETIDEALARAGGPQAVDADAEVQILDQTGAVVAGVGVELPVDQIDVSLAGQSGSDLIRTITVDETDYRVLTRHINGGGAVQVARNLDTSDALVEGIQERVLVVGLVCALLAGGVGLLLARRTTEPLRRLTNTVEDVAETRDLSTSIDLDRADEIGRLADSFDTMLSALADSRRQQHQLVQDAAHELRTPLTSMKANVDLLAHAPDLDMATRTETVEAIRSELRQLQVMFTEIIELATDSHEQSEHRPVALADIVSSAVTNLATRHANPVDVTVDDSTVTGDPVVLERAIDNLLGNAVKFSPPMAPIRIALEQGAVSVSDRGPGLQSGDEERIFDRFYRSVSTQSLPGSGLGLAIVHKIVLDHGGSVFAGNNELGGATIGFRLPLA